jgi:hypothetical protein
MLHKVGGLPRRLISAGLNPDFGRRAHARFKPIEIRLAHCTITAFKAGLISPSDNTTVRLVSMQVYDLERKQLPHSEFKDDMPTGIACPLCNTELYANADIEVKKDLIPAWCTEYKCPWRGSIRVYKEKSTG